MLPVGAGQLADVRGRSGGVVGDDLAEVVVEAQPVQRRGDQVEVPGPLRQVDAVDPPHVLGVAPAVDRVEPPAVDVAVGPDGGGEVGR